MRKRRSWYLIGNITRQRRSWDDELGDLVKDYFTVTTHGGGGDVWLVKEHGKYYITVSTYGRGVTSRWDRRTYNIYGHYEIRDDKVLDFFEKYFTDLERDLCSDETLDKLKKAFAPPVYKKIEKMCFEWGLRTI